jgi:broad specificity phosphatase PhoE
MEMLEVLFVRHGKPYYSQKELEEGIIEGTLREEGTRQVKEAASEIVTIAKRREQTLMLIVHSPRRRARESAALITDALKNAGIETQMYMCKELRDVSFSGAFLDQQYSDVIAGRTSWDRWMEYWMNFGTYDSKTDSPEQVSGRAVRVLNRLMDLASRQVFQRRNVIVVVVGHEEGVRDLLLKALNMRTELGQGQAYAEKVLVTIRIDKARNEADLKVEFRGQYAHLKLAAKGCSTL